jgi:hypothetical protein
MNMMRPVTVAAAATLWACVLLTPAAGSECLPLKELNYVAPTEVERHGLDRSGYYFCDGNAPEQFRCLCPTATVCGSRVSADGRGFGECVCCSTWVYGVIAGLVILLVISIAFCVYACFCRGKWWCDGYHPAIIPFMPRRSPPVVIPGARPLPANLFRGFRSSDFESGYVAPSGAGRPRPGTHNAAPAAALGSTDPESVPMIGIAGSMSPPTDAADTEGGDAEAAAAVHPERVETAGPMDDVAMRVERGRSRSPSGARRRRA